MVQHGNKVHDIMSLAQQKPAEQCIKMPSGDASPDGVSQMSLSKNAEKGSVFKSAWARFGFMSSSKPDAQDKEEPQKQKAGPASVPYSTLFRFTSRRDKLHYGFGLVAAAIHGGVIPVWALVFGTLVGKYLSITDLSLVYSECLPYIGVMVGAGFIAFFAAYFQYMLFHTASERQGRNFRTEYIRAVLRQEQGFFDTHKSGSLTSGLLSDADKMQEAVGIKSSEIMRYTVQALVAFIVPLTQSWKLALVTMSLVPILVLSLTLAKIVGGRRARLMQLVYSDAGNIATEAIAGIRTVQAMPESIAMFEANYTEKLFFALKSGSQQAWIVGCASGVMYAVIPLSFALGLWYGASLVYAGEIDAGTVVSVFASIMIGKTAISFIQPCLQLVSAGTVAAASVFSVIDRDPLIDSSSTSGARPEHVTGNMQLDNVVFSYPSRPDQPVLNGVSVTFETNKVTALVGSSGSGKSSIIGLLQRLYDVQDGAVTLDGHDVRDLNPHWLRTAVGVVSQEPVLFDTTVADNIAYGLPGLTHEDIVQAAKAANAHDFIMQLESQYDTRVGQRGSQLSGGQRQRIAIARALVRQPKILLLDEATSNLDNVSERVVQDALDRASTGRTTVVVAHRLTTIRNADKIVVMDQGAVLEQGTHDELVSRGGLYAKLWAAQAHAQQEYGDQSLASLQNMDEVDLSAADRPTASRSHVSISVTGDEHMEESDEDSAEASPASAKQNVLLRAMVMSKPEAMYLLCGSMAAMVYGAVYPVIGLVYSFLVNALGGPADDIMSAAVKYALMFILIAAVHASSAFVKDSFFILSGERLTFRLRQLGFRSILSQDVEFFDRQANNTGALCSKLANDAGRVQSLFSQQLGNVCALVGCIIAGLTISFWANWIMALVLYSLIPFYALAGILNYKVGVSGAHKGKAGRAAAAQKAQEYIANARTVASLALEDECVQRFDGEWGSVLAATGPRGHIMGATAGLVDLLLFLTYALGFGVGTVLYVNGLLVFQDLLISFEGLLFTAVLIQQAVPTIADTSKASLAAKAMFTLLDSKPVINAALNADSHAALLGDMDGNIAFSRVSFRYPGRPDTQILNSLTFEAKAGQTVALVGGSGCGKSTAIQLLDRVYDAEAGSVSIDGRDVKSLNLRWMRSHVGIVSQEPTLFDTTIGDNIRFGRADLTMDQIIEAAKAANAHDFIMGLEQGYETRMGERGSQLSGGQRQRIAIARALVRQPKILLLDEASSALDTLSEKVVQEALDRAATGRTTIVVAHRLSTIRNADKIVVLGHGRVLEQGTHDELARKRNGEYRQLLAQHEN